MLQFHVSAWLMFMILLHARARYRLLPRAPWNKSRDYQSYVLLMFPPRWRRIICINSSSENRSRSRWLGIICRLLTHRFMRLCAGKIANICVSPTNGCWWWSVAWPKLFMTPDRLSALRASHLQRVIDYKRWDFLHIRKSFNFLPRENFKIVFN